MTITKILATGYFLFASFYSDAQQVEKAMKPLLNGKNLDGWYSFLKLTGKNNDPEKVFNIENGLLHISGKDFGYICTNKEYKNFHLAVEFKWGVKKYPPRDEDTTRRVNGILFYTPLAFKDIVWPRGIECQIQEGDVGDLWMIDSATVVVDGIRTVPKDYSRSIKKKDAENPAGQWNRVEVIAMNGKITYIVNGVVVNECHDPSVTHGKISIQSEGAEIYYRKIEIANFN